MQRERLSHSLLAEVYDLEEDAYRLSVREATRIGCATPAAALRAVVAHANEALEELPTLARERQVRFRSFGGIALDTFRRVRDAVMDQLVDHEHAYRRALTALRKSIDLVCLVHEAAMNERDDGLTAWCDRWLRTRRRLVDEAANELAWFACHPAFSRQPGGVLPAI